MTSLPHHRYLLSRLQREWNMIRGRRSTLRHASTWALTPRALSSLDELLGHPMAGRSWEGLVIDGLMAVVQEDVTAHFYRTSAGAEIDLLLNFPGNRTWAIEIKRSLAPKVEKGFHLACEDLRPTRKIVIYPGTDRFPLQSGIEVLPLSEAMRELHENT